MVSRAISRLEHYMVTAASLLVLVMLLGSVIGATTRFVGIIVPGILETVTVLLVCTVYLTLPLAQRQKQHLSVQILFIHLPLRVQLWSKAVVSLFLVGISVPILRAIAADAWQSFQVREYLMGLVSVPVYPAKILLFLCLVILFLEILIDFVLAAKALRKGELGVRFWQSAPPTT